MYGQNKETEQNNKIQAQQEHPLFSLCTICIYAMYGGTSKYQNCKYFQQVKMLFVDSKHVSKKVMLTFVSLNFP